MKTLLYILLLLPSFAWADAIVFTSEDKQGIMLDVETKQGPIFGKIGLAFSDEVGGAHLGLGFRQGAFSIAAGIIPNATGESLQREIQIGNDVFTDSDDGKGDATFLEIKYDHFFARYTDYQLDYQHSASKELYPGKSLTVVERSRVSDDVLWVGIRFPF